ncbi:MAG TPA: hypothetical protein VFN11_15005 [Ktedonobacterales bacterium]|nr:hypothetical protein [Ktedonobacterales bacterium]
MNPQSLNADAVMQAVRQGYVPDSWRVYHGRVGWQVRQMLGGLLILLLGFSAAVYLLLNPDVAFVPGAAGDSISIEAGQFTVARTVDFAVLALFLLVGFVISVASASRLPTIRGQTLVLMPAGFVLNLKKPTAYAYGAMQALNARNHRGTISFNITPVGNARRQVLRLDGRFGNAKQIATQILMARNEWQRAHAAVPSPQSPQSPQSPTTGSAR